MKLISSKEKQPIKGDLVLRKIGAGKPFVDTIISSRKAIKCNDGVWRLEIETEMHPVLLFEPCKDVLIIENDE